MATPTAVAGGLWQLAKAFHLLVDVLGTDSAQAQAPILTGASDALEHAAGDLRQARADLSHLQDLAAEEHEQRMASVDIEPEAIANSADLEVSLASFVVDVSTSSIRQRVTRSGGPAPFIASGPRCLRCATITGVGDRGVAIGLA